MSDEVLQSYIQQYIEYFPLNQVNFIWQGGEPTLCGLDFFKKVVELQNKYRGEKKIVNSIQTNGILINDNFAKFFKENDFLVGISIDGPEYIHDHNRVSKSGKGTYNLVIKGLECLKKREVNFNTLTVVNNTNFNKAKEVYEHLRQLGSLYMQFIPLTGGCFEINAKEYGLFLNELFDVWFDSEDYQRINIQHIEQWLMALNNIKPHLCIFSKSCGDQLVIEQNGDIYSCDHFVDQEHRLGNILENKLIDIVFSAKQIKFSLDKENVSERCLNCKYLNLCQGGCPCHRVKEGASVENKLCQAYYQAIDHMIDRLSIKQRSL